MAEVITFVSQLRRRLPPWLQRGRAEAVSRSIAAQLDAMRDALVAGVLSRMPGAYSFDSLPRIGRERRIQRGRNESDATYATRLTRWLVDHRRRGGPYAMLAQLHAHYAPVNFAIELIYMSGRRFSMDRYGVIVRDDIAWAPDTDHAKWARWWLIYHWPPFAALGSWDDDPYLWDNTGEVWDSSLTLEDVEDLRLVPREWNTAHAIGHVRLVNGAATLELPIG